MRTIEWTNAFKRDFKKHGNLQSALIEALWKLSTDEPLPQKFGLELKVKSIKNSSRSIALRLNPDGSLFDKYGEALVAKVRGAPLLARPA